jgi:hypothetical protein
MPCGCLGKKVIYNSLTNISLPSQNMSQSKNVSTIKPKIRNNWRRVQEDLQRLK